MSSYEYRRNPANGVESHRIRFGHEGHDRARTFHTEQAARSWQSMLDTVGAHKALALLSPDPRVMLSR